MSTILKSAVRGTMFFAVAALTGMASSGLWQQPHPAEAQDPPQTQPESAAGDYLPVTVPNGATLPFEMVEGVKQFHLIAEPVDVEFSPGLKVKAWGYNGRTPGPVIEAVEGDRVRILVTNNLPEGHSVHWHGLFVPNGMDGLVGLHQDEIPVGETFSYEFTLRQHGTYMYHSHYDEMTQMAMGLMGFFIIHPKNPTGPKVDRDFAIFLQEWKILPGSMTPDPNEMLDFNYFTFNSTVLPTAEALVVRSGQRVRLRLANLSMNNHPIHLHGHTWEVTGSEGGPIKESAWQSGNTVDVAPGTTRVMEWVADLPGDWPIHCHKTHHTMIGMGHGLPNLTGIPEKTAEDAIRRLLPDYEQMGHNGMADMHEMQMSGMFTILKVRDDITTYEDPGWYQHPPGTVAKPWKK